MRQAERRARTSSALLRAARSAFASDGYEGASLDSIATRATLSKGAVYTHFDSKLQLFQAVVEATLREASARVQRVVEALRAGADVQTASACYFGDVNDAEHVALMSEAWRVATSETGVRSHLEAFRRQRRLDCSRGAVDGGANPAEALRVAQVVSALIDAATLDQRLGLAASG
jgi:AcrR family transcriptional regulator